MTHREGYIRKASNYFHLQNKMIESKVLSIHSCTLQSNWLQEMEATQRQIQRASQELLHAREQANEEVMQLKATVQLVEEAVQNLDLTLASNNDSSSMLCLSGIGDFKEVDSALLSEMTSYWTAQVFSAPTCTQLLEV